LKRLFWLLFALLLLPPALFAQTSVAEDVQSGAAKTIQPSETASLIAQPPGSVVKVPAGTRIEIEVAYTVNSLDVKSGERISFRVLIPIIIDGVTVIEEDARGYSANYSS
jgi:hypothetical protein